MPVTKLRLELEEIGRGIFDPHYVISKAFDETGSLRYELVTGTTDQAMPISTTTGIATIQAFYIYSSQTITIRQVAADTGEQVTANSPYLVFGTSRTALLVSNASGSTANIDIWVGGT